MGIPVHNSDLLYHIIQSVSTASSRYDAFFFFIQKTRRTQIKSPARFAICLVEKRDAADQRQGLLLPLDGVDKTHDGEYQQYDSHQCIQRPHDAGEQAKADHTDDTIGNAVNNGPDYTAHGQHQRLIKPSILICSDCL